MSLKTLRAKALLFDMDGTLVDSTRIVEGEWQAFSKKHGLNVVEVLEYAHGRQSRDTIEHFLGPGQAAQHALDTLAYNELNKFDGIVANAGAKELLDSLPEKRWALVTSAGRELACRRMEAAGLPLPSVMICAEDVESGKPDPEGYNTAAKMLSVLSSECAVFEDAPAGIRAGVSAGAAVIVINPVGSVPLQGTEGIFSLTNLKFKMVDDWIEICLTC
jgi:mannitol-1-/sugar-/sorbitol-6-phosphatase